MLSQPDVVERRRRRVMLLCSRAERGLGHVVLSPRSSHPAVDAAYWEARRLGDDAQAKLFSPATTVEECEEAVAAFVESIDVVNAAFHRATTEETRMRVRLLGALTRAPRGRRRRREHRATRRGGSASRGSPGRPDAEPDLAGGRA